MNWPPLLYSHRDFDGADTTFHFRYAFFLRFRRYSRFVGKVPTVPDKINEWIHPIQRRRKFFDRDGTNFAGCIVLGGNNIELDASSNPTLSFVLQIIYIDVFCCQIAKKVQIANPAINRKQGRGSAPISLSTNSPCKGHSFDRRSQIAISNLLNGN